MVAKKKIAVRDKYYNLAKEQGYRARSSFKLVQLNRKYDLLAKATRVIDLCAAPGGWLQVCAKHMPKTAETQIIGVDLMHIKPIRGCVTFQEDITTEKCKVIIKKEMKGKKADLVLCDGAPNVGANYSKDAFVQNELTVHALKFACDHLVKGGVFITKVFRSSDYNALMWSFQQLFAKVEATKPESSRNVSAEIFVVCRDFLAPHKVDPKLLDPKYVLGEIDEKGELTATQAATDLFHKKSGQKKNRAGYDVSMGQSLFKSVSAAEFVAGNEAMQMLASSNKIDINDEDSIGILQHKATNPEIIEYLSDLKVLGKGELRLILRWRSEIRKSHKESAVAADVSSGESVSGSEAESDDSAELAEIDDELDGLRKEEAKMKKREKRKVARERSKVQQRIDLGMDNQFAVDVSQFEGPFSLKSLGIKTRSDLDAIREVNISKASGKAVPLHGADSDEDSVNFGSDDEDMDAEDRKLNYEKEMEDNIDYHYQQSKKNQGSLEPLSVQQRRQQVQAEKKAKLKKRELEAKTAIDVSNAIDEMQYEELQKGAYLKQLQGEKDSDDSGMSDSDSESEEEQAVSTKPSFDSKVKKIRLKANPLLVDFQPEDPSDQKRVERFFKQKVFEGVESDEDDDEPQDKQFEASDEDDSHVPLPSSRTDKAKRKEKRSKLKTRNERKIEKRAQALEKEVGVAEPSYGFETVAGSKRNYSSDEDEEDEDAGKTPEQLERERKAKLLISKGIGKMAPGKEKAGFEVVPVSRAPVDSSDSEMEEEYNSEDYDTDERAQHLALGAALTKKSKRRKLLDAAYNRYAFNDDALPDWFVEDENKHNRPQLPVTREMVDAIKARYKDLMAAPIGKVQEARARKKRLATSKLESVKRKAAALIDQPDLNAKSKMRAIEKLYKGAEIKKPNSVYVVAKSAGKGKVNVSGMQNGQKVKLVDKRMKADSGRGDVSKRRNAKKAGKKLSSKRRR